MGQLKISGDGWGRMQAGCPKAFPLVKDVEDMDLAVIDHAHDTIKLDTITKSEEAAILSGNALRFYHLQ